jgi:hypothetical protein
MPVDKLFRASFSLPFSNPSLNDWSRQRDLPCGLLFDAGNQGEEVGTLVNQLLW